MRREMKTIEIITDTAGIEDRFKSADERKLFLAMERDCSNTSLLQFMARRRDRDSPGVHGIQMILTANAFGS
jgi:hypothetical protein